MMQVHQMEHELSACIRRSPTEPGFPPCSLLGPLRVRGLAGALRAQYAVRCGIWK